MKITPYLQSSVVIWQRFWEDVGPYLSCQLPFLPLTDTGSCQQEIKKVGVKKAVKVSSPSFAAFGNELEAAADVSGFSTVAPPSCTLHTEHCLLVLTAHLGAFPKGRPL